MKNLFKISLKTFIYLVNVVLIVFLVWGYFKCDVFVTNPITRQTYDGFGRLQSDPPLFLKSLLSNAGFSNWAGWGWFLIDTLIPIIILTLVIYLSKLANFLKDKDNRPIRPDPFIKIINSLKDKNHSVEK